MGNIAGVGKPGAIQRAAIAIGSLALAACSAEMHAQKRVEADLFVDYLSVSQTNTQNFGLGGRLGYRVHSNVMMEGELSYGYGVNFQELYVNVSNGNAAAIEATSIGVTDGLFGPMLQPAHGHLRPFATLKGGFMDFRLSPSLLPYSTAVSTLAGIRTSDVNAVLYPGGGVEATLGPVGLRVDAGDAIYFNNGAHNNLRITFGPLIRF